MQINHTAVPTVFAGYGKHGDWEWMRDQPYWAHCLFVFNDNEEQFDAFISGLDSGYTRGAGNAVARPWRQLNPPKSAGIPTGKLGFGYRHLDPAAKEKIDQALTVAYDLLKSFYYDHLVFSSDESMSTLGIGTFEVGEDVRKYIFNRLTQTPDEWKQFIHERTNEKFRQVSKAYREACKNGEQTDETNPVVQKTRDDFRQLLQIRRK
jgi:hypothetical protein